MTRRYADSVDVQRRDDVPDRFLWRGRLYVIRGVLAHWVEAGAWWRSGSTRALFAADERAESPHSDTGRLPDGLPDAAVGKAVDDGEREFWRVEAASGGSGEAGVYDLCFDWSAGGWSLVRALD